MFRVGGNGVLSTPEPKWIYPTLINGWVSDSESPFKYTKDLFGNIIVKGRAIPTDSTGPYIICDARGYRPFKIKQNIVIPSIAGTSFMPTAALFSPPNGHVGVSTHE